MLPGNEAFWIIIRIEMKSKYTADRSEIQGFIDRFYGLRHLFPGIILHGTAVHPPVLLAFSFAMLTRKKGQRMSSMCVAGIWLSCVGLALGIFITISSIVTVFTDPSYRNMLDQMYQQMYGVDMEGFWQSYL